MDEFIMFPVPRSQFAAVCALLGGVSGNAVTVSPAPTTTGEIKPQAIEPSPASSPTVTPETDTSSASTAASPSDDSEVDANGHPWSADLHASTRAKTGAGLWRMKPGATRPEPAPGFPKEDATGTASTSTEASAGNSASATTATEADDDEFAAFRDALSGDAEKTVEVPARKWTDADLGALCNQAAVKLGDPAPVKALIADYTPEGAVAHSRNIPDDKRAEFAAAVEKKAGIEFDG